MNYIDFVIVKIKDTERKLLCVAPAFSYLKKGDKAVIENDVVVDVIASEAFKKDDENSTVRMILDTFDIKSIDDVTKLSARLEIVKFKYKEEVKE